MEDCTESHQAEISRKIKGNDKLRKILTNMACQMNTNRSSTVTVSRQKMQSLDHEKSGLVGSQEAILTSAKSD